MMRAPAMNLTRAGVAFAALALVARLVLGAAPAVAGPREEALAALAESTDPALRREAVETLADRATMQDVPVLVRALRDADAVVRRLAEGALWQVWSRSGDAEIDRLLAVGVEQLNEQRLTESVDTFSTIIDKKPEFAEGWNKRATAYFLLGRYDRSLADCDETVKRNPYHFGALSGYGLIYLQLNQPARALEYFERALTIDPNLDQVRESIEALKAIVIRQRRDTL